MPETFDIVFLGTGSPLPSADRCGAGQVVIAGDTHILVDCGWGAARRILPAGLWANQIDIAIFTHMHTDHITDFPDFLFLRWTSGATKPLRVFGPEGTREMVEGFQMALRRDIGFRLKHHEGKLHPDGIKIEVTEIPTTKAPERFLDLGGLQVESFEVDHFPVVPAFGYRVLWDGRNVVLSGDTSFCDSLAAASQGADVLVCEAINVGMLEERIFALRKMGRELQASLFEDVPSYHLPTADVARLAKQAGVGRLVLSHLIPPIPSQGPAVDQFTAGMNGIYGGTIHVAKDMERVTVTKRGEG